jgi:hypothetical protein
MMEGRHPALPHLLVVACGETRQVTITCEHCGASETLTGMAAFRPSGQFLRDHLHGLEAPKSLEGLIIADHHTHTVGHVVADRPEEWPEVLEETGEGE